MKFNLLGKPFSNAVASSQRLRKLLALPILASDALSSVAYGSEEILRVLMFAGVAALGLSLYISAVICLLLAMLCASYYQTIQAYPNGGGAFVVTYENLGSFPGLLASTALMLDYVLTVAVSIAAGVFAVSSAVPVLLPHAILLCLLTILLITLANLRGVRDSARLFACPTYLFIGLVITMLVIGIWKAHAHPELVQTFAKHQQNPLLSSQVMLALSVYLILNAFSQGCSAVTGIECISNAVPVFEKPEVSNARKTLIAMACLLGGMFFGISYLANFLHVIPQNNQSVLSQLGHFVFNNSVLYYTLQASTAAVLVLAANTAFNGFPRIASVLSQHNFLPKQFSSPGDRLSFSNGIVCLAGAASLFIILFQGNVDRLIPLYSIGVYVAFSLSQLGMVHFWWKSGVPKWYVKSCINGLGCVATLTALCVIAGSKFMQGAWMSIVVIAILPLICLLIQKHYRTVTQELSISLDEAKNYWSEMAEVKPKVVVPIVQIHRGTLAALNFARDLSDDIEAVCIDTDPEATKTLQAFWCALNLNITLTVIPSPYREIIVPLKQFIHAQDQREPNRGLAVVVMPETVPAKWWHYLLHNRRATMLKASLLLDDGPKNSGRVFVTVPYKLKK